LTLFSGVRKFSQTTQQAANAAQRFSKEDTKSPQQRAKENEAEQNFSRFGNEAEQTVFSLPLWNSLPARRSYLATNNWQQIKPDLAKVFFRRHHGTFFRREDVT
jgi:hypothetical protein